MRSRNARLDSCASSGWLVVFCSVTSHLPSRPRAAAACRAAPIWPADRPVEVRDLVDHDGAVRGGLEHVLLEARAQGGDLSVQHAQARLLRARQTRPVAYHLGVVARQQLQLLGVQLQARALAVQRVHPRPQRRVQLDRIRVRGELGRHLGIDALHLRIGVARVQPSEGAVHPLQQAPGTLQRNDGVVERGRLPVVRDGGNLAQLLGHARRVGRQEVLVVDAVERRQLERQCARLCERVVGHGSPCGVVAGRRAGGQSSHRQRHGADRQVHRSHGCCSVYGPAVPNGVGPRARQCYPSDPSAARPKARRTRWHCPIGQRLPIHLQGLT